MFMPHESQTEKSILELLTLVTNFDSGPLPWVGHAFRMYHLRLRELPQRDVYHMIWRILMNGTREAGLRSMMLITVCNLNLAHGPFGWGNGFKHL